MNNDDLREPMSVDVFVDVGDVRTGLRYARLQDGAWGDLSEVSAPIGSAWREPTCDERAFWRIETVRAAIEEACEEYAAATGASKAQSDIEERGRSR